MAHDGLQEAAADLSGETRDLHRALVSLQEELEAVDSYRQRADACSDSELRSILLHLMRDEMEHAAMLTEWLRRGDEGFAAELRTYLFTGAPIVEIEAAADATNATNATDATKAESSPTVEDDQAATIGSLKETHA